MKKIWEKFGNTVLNITILTLIFFVIFFVSFLLKDSYGRIHGEYIYDKGAPNRYSTVRIDGENYTISFLRERKIKNSSSPLADIGWFDILFGDPLKSINMSGYYSAQKGYIYINPLASNYYRTLTHEYGHALLYDYYSRDSGDNIMKESIATLKYSIANSLTQDNPDYYKYMLPTELRPVFMEYKYKVIPDLYGNDGYYTTNFGEYLAESHSRLLHRYGVLQEMKIFYTDYLIDSSQ